MPSKRGWLRHKSRLALNPWMRSRLITACEAAQVVNVGWGALRLHDKNILYLPGLFLARILKLGAQNLQLSNIWPSYFQGSSHYIQMTTIDVYLLCMMSLYNVLGIVLRLKNFNYMLEMDILRNQSQNIWVSTGVILEGLGIQMTPRHPKAMVSPLPGYFIKIFLL